MAKLVSKTYGEALFETAMENHMGDDLQEEAEGLLKVLADNKDFDGLMRHPGVPKQEKIELIKKIFQGRLSGEMLAFLELVVRKERYKDLPAIFGYFMGKIKEEKKIGTAYVTTAVPLDDRQKSQVQDKLLKTTPYLTLEMHYQVDKGMIGGMIIRIKDRVVDNSIRTKLDDLTKQLLQIQLGGHLS